MNIVYRILIRIMFTKQERDMIMAYLYGYLDLNTKAGTIGNNANNMLISFSIIKLLKKFG